MTIRNVMGECSPLQNEWPTKTAPSNEIAKEEAKRHL